MKRYISLALCLLVASASFSQTYTLAEYEDFALQNSKSLKVAQERVNAAEQLKKAAFTQFLPSFQAVGTYTWNQKNISLLSEDALLPVGTKMADGSFGFTADQISNSWTVIDGQPVPLDADGVPFNPKTNPEKIQWKQYAYLPKSELTYDVHNVFAAGIGFTQPIFLGGKVRELYNIAKVSEEMARLQTDNRQEELIISVDQAYWTTVSLINKKKLAEKYVELLTKLEKNIQASINEGVATKGDLLNVKVKLNEANLALTRATNGVTLSKMALFRVCGLDLDGDFGLADEDITQGQAQELDPAYNRAQAIDSRFEIRELENLSKISHSQTNIAKSRFMPNILASANYLTTNPNTFNGFENKFKGMFSAGVAITIPIFHFGDRIHTLKAAQSEERIIRHRIDEAKELINLQVTQANFKVREANKKLETAQSNISAAEENLRLAELSYKEGLISVTDLLAAQTAWISANSDKIDAGIDARMCELYLRKAVGISNLKREE
ncbi:MAG: TolC family protein [Bacteroidales bacterium]|nr:TolC family protein [Bacteroidales bacterium]